MKGKGKLQTRNRTDQLGKICPVASAEGVKGNSNTPEIQDGDPGNHQDLSPKGRMGNLHRLQGRLLPHSHTGTVQEVPEISFPGSDIPVQSTAIRSVDSRHGVPYYSKRGKADGHSERYKDPPIPRRLVGESHIPPGLSPTYTGPSKNVPTFRLAGECRKVGTGTQTSFQLRRLPIRPPVRSGPTDTGPVAKPTGKDTGTHLPTGLFGKGADVLDRPFNSHRKTSSSGQTTHEAHPMASQKKLENTGIVRKRIPLPRSLYPHLQWWLEEDNVLTGQPLHPMQHALQIFTDASKEG